jgi:hypothetical protein
VTCKSAEIRKWIEEEVNRRGVLTYKDIIREKGCGYTSSLTWIGAFCPKGCRAESGVCDCRDRKGDTA